MGVLVQRGADDPTPYSRLLASARVCSSLLAAHITQFQSLSRVRMWRWRSLGAAERDTLNTLTKRLQIAKLLRVGSGCKALLPPCKGGQINSTEV